MKRSQTKWRGPKPNEEAPNQMKTPQTKWRCPKPNEDAPTQMKMPQTKWMYPLIPKGGPFPKTNDLHTTPLTENDRSHQFRYLACNLFGLPVHHQCLPLPTSAMGYKLRDFTPGRERNSTRSGRCRWSPSRGTWALFLPTHNKQFCLRFVKAMFTALSGKTSSICLKWKAHVLSWRKVFPSSMVLCS